MDREVDRDGEVRLILIWRLRLCGGWPCHWVTMGAQSAQLVRTTGDSNSYASTDTRKPQHLTVVHKLHPDLSAKPWGVLIPTF